MPAAINASRTAIARRAPAFCSVASFMIFMRPHWQRHDNAKWRTQFLWSLTAGSESAD
jgi:hypothetical protein